MITVFKAADQCTVLLCVADETPGFVLAYLNAGQNCIHLLAVPAALEVPFGGKNVPLADCYAAAGPARCREALGEVFALPEDTDYLAIAPAVLTKLAARYGAVRVGFTGALTPEQLARYGKGTGVQGISAADAHSFLAALDADTSLSPRRTESFSEKDLWIIQKAKELRQYIKNNRSDKHPGAAPPHGRRCGMRFSGRRWSCCPPPCRRVCGR